jgi:hypothetical protein
MHMPDLNETSTEEIKSVCLKCRVLVMSIHPRDEVAEFAEILGAEACLDKAKLHEELIPATTK